MRNIALSLMLSAVASPALAAPPLPPANFMSIEPAEPGSFAAREEELKQAASDGRVDEVLSLAHFYAMRELWAETLGALKRIDVQASPAAQLLAGESEYRMGRYDDAARRLDGLVRGAPLRAMALTRLGAYDRALDIFRNVPSTDHDADYWLAFAEAALDNDRAGAAAALEKARGRGFAEGLQSRHAFLRARLAQDRGAKTRAAAGFRLAASGNDEWAMRGRLALIDPADTASLMGLSLRWAGGAFERELNLALAAAWIDQGELERGLSAFRLIIDRNPQSDAALFAQQRIAETLPELFSDGAPLAAKDAARIFFDNVEFAPPGKKGDELLRKASLRLRALGLDRQAALLLDHQVFKRLRGKARAQIAADLAEAWLEAGESDKALRALRSTRIAGLDEAANRRRRRLEALCLAGAGEPEAAIAMLGKNPGAADLRMRADIAWDASMWKRASADYASLVVAHAGAPNASMREAAMRAAASFMLASDDAGYRAFASEALIRLGPAPEAALIASLGEVARDGAFTEDFMRRYRAVFDGDRK